MLTDARCSGVFAEKVSSTVPSHKRAALQEALGAVAPGDTVVVSKLDRLGRTQSEVVARLDILQEQGVFVKTMDDLMVTASLSKMAPLVVGLLTGLAEVKRNLVQERTRESFEHRRRTGGGKLGGRLPLDEGRRELVKRLREEGRTYREVAETCGVSLASAVPVRQKLGCYRNLHKSNIVNLLSVAREIVQVCQEHITSFV